MLSIGGGDLAKLTIFRYWGDDLAKLNIFWIISTRASWMVYGQLVYGLRTNSMAVWNL